MSDFDDYDLDQDDDPWADPAQDEEGNELAIEIENNFYEADDKKNSDYTGALEQFEKVISLYESAPDDDDRTYEFKALENIVVLSCRLGLKDKMMVTHHQLLKQIDKASRNEAEDAINNILDAAAENKVSSELFHITLESLEKSNNEKLWFKTSIRLARVYLDKGELDLVYPLIENLKKSCQTPEGQDDLNKAASLLEIYALEIHLCTLNKETKKSKMIYSKTTSLNAAIADPKTLSIIKESGGKMYMSERNWDQALTEFNESFKYYQEIGHSKAKAVLKYVVLASILSGSAINPFDSQEAKVYKDDEEILAMVSLRDAYEENDINKINYLLHDKKKKILEDPFICEYLDDLLKNIRLNILELKIKPYKTINLRFLAREIRINESELRALVVELILDEKIQGKIDDVNGYLEITSSNSTEFRRHKAIEKWSKSLKALHTQLLEKVK
eukprot:CAMPEP_0115010344 /NCGR_PEP_ID=MMETSP0216-20121206/23255_1 /TAXON_ID=223996 /ORGANISM="Protocruzia adherens, Strain Boccale" /LENGTH=445 /DNA_ID=CAMNT_0002378531 /DNA_START=62 /DNA_END=1399 /DNA_ORIENTATION=+